MFGGVCFMHHGNMMCGADLKNGLMVRVGPGQFDKVIRLKYARRMDITGTPMKGFVFVESNGYRTKAMLARWIDRGIAFTRTLDRK